MAQRRYAQNTSVPVDRSKSELERLIKRYGAEKYGNLTEPDRDHIMFQVGPLSIRISVPMPKDDERERRRRWRALVLTLKAKLEAVQSEISTLEREFLPHIVMPDGQTVSEHLLPRLSHALETGKLPELALPAPAG